jgi:FMN reductase
MSASSVFVPPVQREIHVVGLGGTTRPNSSSEVALRAALAAAEELGASTSIFTGADLLQLPHFDPATAGESELGQRVVAELRRADGVIIASPGYHGSVSGMVKNALDFAELMNSDDPAYLSGRSIGLITTAAGWQAANTTMAALRSIAHALRGWTTPYGATINSTQVKLRDIESLDEGTRAALQLVATEVVDFARRR